MASGITVSSPEKLPVLILTGVLLILHFILVPLTSTWPPTMPLIACALAAIPFSKRNTRKRRRRKNTPLKYKNRYNTSAGILNIQSSVHNPTP